jgi:hypothetical protein
MQISVFIFHSLFIKLFIIYIYPGVGLNNAEDSCRSGVHMFNVNQYYSAPLLSGFCSLFLMCNFSFWSLAALYAEVLYCSTFIYIRSVPSPVSLTLKMATAMYADVLQHLVQLDPET